MSGPIDNFLDTEKREEIMVKIGEKNTLEEVEELIEEYYPGWLIFSFTDYSNDYPHLDKNWRTLCQRIGVVKQKIVLVSDIKFDAEHTIINKISEFMTKNGYCVRRMSEFVVCPVCEGVIPCEQVWRLLKEKNFPVPNLWSNKCISC